MSHVLLVDDDLRFRRAMRLALDSFDFEVSEAGNSEQALDSVATRAPDVIVLDWHLPTASGTETCRALRAQYDVPIIMISANRSNSKQLALDAGATAFLAKPFSLDDLVTHIRSALRH